MRHEETGLLFEPKNHFKLRECCQMLFNNMDKCKKMGQEGRIWVRNTISEDKHYQKLLSLFRGLVEDNN